MPAPSISNLVLIDPSDGNTWTNAAVATATQPFNDTSSTGTPGIDGDTGSSAQAMGNTGIGVVAGTRYSAYRTFSSSYDISGAQQAIAFHWASDGSVFTLLSSAADAIQVVFFSGGTLTNYAYFNLGGSGSPIYPGVFSWKPIIISGDSPDGTGGSWDSTDVTAIGITALMASTGTFNFGVYVNQIIHIDGEVSFDDGDGTTNGTIQAYFDELAADSGNSFHSLLVEKAGRGFNFGFPVRLNSTLFNDSLFSFGFRKLDGIQRDYAPAGYFSLTIDPPAAGTITISDASFTAEDNDYALTISPGTDSVNITNTIFGNTNDVVVSGSGCTITGGAIPNASNIDLASATIPNISIDSCANPIIISAILGSGSSLNITNPGADALQFDFAPADDSGTTYNLPASSVVNYNPSTTGTYNSSGLVNTSGSVELDNVSANNITVQLPSALSFSVASPTTGGGTLTPSTPPVTVVYSAPNLIDDTRVRLYNVTQATEIQNTVVSGGSGYSITLTRGTDYNNGDTVTLLATYQVGGSARRVFRSSAVLTTADFTTNDLQVNWDDPGPNTLGIDGSTVSECTANYASSRVEINDSDNTTTKARIAAFIVDAISTEDGIRNWVGLDGTPVIFYTTNTAATIETSVDTLSILNTKTTDELQVQDSFEFDWSDGIDRVSTQTGPSTLWVTPPRVLLQETGVSGLTPEESAQLGQIDAVDSNVDILVQDQGLDASSPKTITENTEGVSYDESFGSITKEIRRSGNTTTVTRTS